jgi:peptidoglycan hydrolase-like protein with peptidoglycan-binding domain
MKIIITEEQLKKIMEIKTTLHEVALSSPVPYNGVNTSIPEGTLKLYDGLGKGRREKRDEVRQMQQDLITLNYILPRFGVDGKFGRETLVSVNAFQKDHGFVESETVTQEMLTALKNPKNLNKNPEINDPKQVKKHAKQGNIKPFSPAVVDAIRKASGENGVSEELMFTIANIESGGDPTARNKRSGASGLYQIMPKYFNDYGVNGTTVWDPYENADAAAKGLKRKIERLTKVIKSSPTNPQIYMAHNQGSGGFEIIYNACKNFGGLDGKESLQQSSNSLGYGRRTGSKIYRNMRGNKGNHPCQFMDSWGDIYDSKKTSYA